MIPGLVPAGSKAEGPDHEIMAGPSHKDSEMKAESRTPCIVVLGMAGSGKTTFVQVRFLHSPLIKTVFSKLDLIKG